MNQHTRQALFERLRSVNPQPATELTYASTFELLVAVMLSAQATDKGVNQVTARLFPLANTPQALLALGEEGLRAQLRTLGLFNTKARNLLRTCAILIAEHGGQVPRARQALEALPGVGRKTANVVLNVAFGEPTLAVDTHVFRVANRTRLAVGKTPREVERQLLQQVPEGFLRHAHHWLVLHGRHVCKARKPLCPSCRIAEFCAYPDKTPAA